MKTRATNILVGFTVLFLAANACGAPAPSSPDVPPELQRQPAPIEPVESNTPEPTAASTAESPSPEVTADPTSTIPLVTFLEPTTCREGPGEVYEEIATAEVGPEYSVVGRYSPENYFIILLDDELRCWVEGSSVRQDGDFAKLPEIPAPVGSIRGTVLDYEASTPIENAPLKLKPSKMATRTDKDGKFRFANVPIGRVTIVLEISDEQPASLIITLHDGQHYEQANFGLRDGVPLLRLPSCPGWRTCIVATIEPPVNAPP